MQAICDESVCLLYFFCCVSRIVFSAGSTSTFSAKTIIADAHRERAANDVHCHLCCTQQSFAGYIAASNRRQFVQATQGSICCGAVTPACKQHPCWLLLSSELSWHVPYVLQSCAPTVSCKPHTCTTCSPFCQAPLPASIHLSAQLSESTKQE